MGGVGGWGGGGTSKNRNSKEMERKKKKKFVPLRRPLDVGPYLGHLASKYGPLYDLPPGRAEDLVATGLKLAEEALERARKR